MPNKIQDLHTVDDKSFDYVFEQNATVTLRSSEGLVRVNVYRPKTSEKVPVLVTYGPYVQMTNPSARARTNSRQLRKGHPIC
jgi:predicted acyl esterase